MNPVLPKEPKDNDIEYASVYIRVLGQYLNAVIYQLDTVNFVLIFAHICGPFSQRVEAPISELQAH